mgnify:CR=1 FL=1
MSVRDLPDWTGYSEVENVYGDVKIYTPSGLWVVGSDIITARAVSGTLLVAGGYEDDIFATDPSVPTRGRIRQIGLDLWKFKPAGYADAFNDAILRIYLDDDVDAGKPTIEMYVWDIDLLNGGEIVNRVHRQLYDTTITVDSNTWEVYYARNVSQRGGVTVAYYDRPNLIYMGASCWISLDCEWLEKVKVALYNKNPNPDLKLYGHAVVLYGLYP